MRGRMYEERKDLRSLGGGFMGRKWGLSVVLDGGHRLGGVGQEYRVRLVDLFCEQFYHPAEDGVSGVL